MKYHAIVIALGAMMAAQGAAAEDVKTIRFTSMGVACKSMEALMLIADQAQRNGEQAVVAMATAGVLTGDCEMFEKGDKVVVVNRIGVALQIRRPGSLQTFWTPTAFTE